MGPIVTKVEDIDKLLPGPEPRELHEALIENRLFVFPLRLADPNPSAVAKLEFMQM
jgi:hypothetical protein